MPHYKSMIMMVLLVLRASSNPVSYGMVFTQPNVTIPSNTSTGAIQWPPHGYSYQETVLRHHNVHRANHSAQPLQWGLNMLKAATKLAQTCVYEHNTDIDGGGYGQNIGAGTLPSHVSEMLTNEMYNAEINFFDGQYGLANPNFANFDQFGHFSQLVWESTTHVACFTADCSAQGLIDGSTGQNLADENIPAYFTVCNYFPPGNVGGAWDTNVHKPLGRGTVGAQY